MEKTVRSIIGDKLQTAQKVNRPYTYSPNSVMNDILGVLPNEYPAGTPWTQYATIGIGGMATKWYDNNTRSEQYPLPHDPSHTGLYLQVPWVARPIQEDLTADERRKFRLRTIQDVRGTMMALYWGRVLDLTNTQVRIEYRQIQNGQINSEPWEPSQANQFPKPPVLGQGQILVTGDDYLASTAKTTLKLSSWDMSELVNVGVALYQSEDAILLTEIGLCSGIDVQHRGNFNGQMLQYTEAAGVQITDFVSVFLPSNFNRAGATVNLDIGSVEPLLELRSAPKTP